MARLAIVLSHPTQYYSPWFRWMSERSGVELRVFYLWNFGVTSTHDRQFGRAFAWDVNLLEGYEHEFVPNTSRDPGTHHFRGLRNPALIERLDAQRPDAVLLFGYKYATHVDVIRWARRKRVPLIFRGDSHFLGRAQPGLLRRQLLQLVYRQFAALTYVGEANRQYFKTLGVPDTRLFFAPHAVDHELFNPALAIHRDAAAALRTQLGLTPEAIVVLFAGKLVPAKQPGELLDAFLRLDRSDVHLVLVGDGEERQRLIERAASANATRVHFLPFANQTEMPARYLLADLFVLPSRGLYETWGLAVNEAMHLGVPALVSDRVGSHLDLIAEGKTGWVFRADDPADLSRRLAEAVPEVRARREELRANVLARISHYTYAQATDGLLAALAKVSAESG